MKYRKLRIAWSVGWGLVEICQQVVDEFFQAASCSCLTPSMKVIP